MVSVLQDYTEGSVPARVRQDFCFRQTQRNFRAKGGIIYLVVLSTKYLSYYLNLLLFLLIFFTVAALFLLFSGRLSIMLLLGFLFMLVVMVAFVLLFLRFLLRDSERIFNPRENLHVSS